MNLELDLNYAAPQLFWPDITRALGQAIVMTPMSAIAMVGIAPAEAGAASGLFNMMRNLGGAIGTAAVETFFTKREQFHSAIITPSVSLLEPATRARLGNDEPIGLSTMNVLVAGAAAVAAAGAPASSVSPRQDADSPDAELISLCNRLVTLEAARRTILYAQHTTEDELRTEPELDAVCDEQQAVFDRITALPEPVTLAGASAMARAALSEAPIDHDGSLSPMDNAEWLAFGAITFLAAPRPTGEDRDLSARKSGEPDAKLLAMCIAFHEQHAAAETVADGDEDDLMAAIDKRWSISDRIKEIPAATDAGRRAKARVAVVLLHENGAAESFSDADKSFAYAALLDISGRTAA